jgi:Trk K+ transport system NAD-binding subunit
VVGRKALEFDLDGQRRVVAVSRFGVPRVPDADLTIQEGDIMHIGVVRSALDTLDEDLKKIGHPK